MIVMDDFEFPVLQGEEEHHLVHPPQLAEDDESEAVPFHRLVGLPSDQLPKTAPRTSSTGTIGDALRGIQAPKWGSAARARLPSSNGAPNAAAAPAAPSQSHHSSSSAAAQVAPGHNAAVLGGAAAAPTQSAAANLSTGARDANASAAGSTQRWMPTQKRQTPWSDHETDVFYDGIAQFGTNFSAIAVLLVHRTRTEVLLKYKQELQKRPERMANALLPSQRKAVDLARFAECKQKYDALQAPPVQALNAEEEAHLLAINEELGQGNAAGVSAAARAAPFSAAPHPRSGPSRRADKSAGTAAAVTAVGSSNIPPPPRTVTQPNVDRDFLFGDDGDDEDVPLAELYAARRPVPRAKRAGAASSPSSSPQVISPPTVASPLTGTSTGTATGSGQRAKKPPRATESQSPNTTTTATSGTSTSEATVPQKSRKKAAVQATASAVDPKAAASMSAAGPSRDGASSQPAQKRARSAAAADDAPITRHDNPVGDSPAITASATSPSTGGKKKKSQQKAPAAKPPARRKGKHPDAQKTSIAEEFDFETSLTTAASSTHANQHLFPATLPDDLPGDEFGNQDLVLDAPEEGWMDDDTLF